MGRSASTPTRVTADVAAIAASVAPSENRTITEQINYWVRIGIQIERSGSVATRRVLDVANGTAQFSSITPTERAVAHAVIDARMAERIAKQRFGPDARAAGRSTVSIDDDGNLIEIAADGARRTL